MIVKNGVLDVTADTNDNLVYMPDAVANDDGSITGMVEIITATTGIRFGIGTAVGAYPNPQGRKFFITWKPGSNPLYFKKENATDEFVITV